MGVGERGEGGREGREGGWREGGGFAGRWGRGLWVEEREGEGGMIVGGGIGVSGRWKGVRGRVG